MLIIAAILSRLFFWSSALWRNDILSDVVLEFRPWHRAPLEAKFYGLGLGPEGPCLGLGLDSCTDNFGISLKLKSVNNSYNNKLIIIYK